MRAVVVQRHGGPEVLEVRDVEAPKAGPGQVVDVAAAGVNFMDIHQRQGNPPYSGNPPFVPGAEGSGTVAAVGPGVTGLAEGDRVAWTGVPGSYAQQVVVPADHAVPLPDGVDLRVAAAVLLQGMTAPARPSATTSPTATATGRAAAFTPKAGLGHVVATASAQQRKVPPSLPAVIALGIATLGTGGRRVSDEFGEVVRSTT